MGHADQLDKLPSWVGYWISIVVSIAFWAILESHLGAWWQGLLMLAMMISIYMVASAIDQLVGRIKARHADELEALHLANQQIRWDLDEARRRLAEYEPTLPR